MTAMQRSCLSLGWLCIPGSPFIDDFRDQKNFAEQVGQQIQALNTAQRNNGRGIGKYDHNKAVSRAKSSTASSRRVAPAAQVM